MPFPTLPPALAEALAERDYREPTPVQAAVLEPAADGRDLLVSAQTGSGKTVAFGLALAPTLLGGADRFGPAGAPLALVIAPTRELALQVQGELTWLYARTGARVISCVGGTDLRRDQRNLADGAHIVVGTPGRLRDHIDRRRLEVDALRAVVLDEADEMLDLGFREDLQAILGATPAQRRTLLFSATIAREIATLAREHQRDALRIDTVIRDQPHGDIQYQAVRVAARDLEHAVVNLLRFHEAKATLVFCATRESVRRLHGSLMERGFDAVALSGEMTQAERSRALQSLRDGRSRVCVATDVAARGLDLPDLGLVIHADLPGSRETLLHRSGRTGRAGRKGISALVVPANRMRRAEGLFAAAGVEAEWRSAPTAEDILGRDLDRLVADPLLAEAPAEDEASLVDALVGAHDPRAIAAGLVRLWRSRHPAPEELMDLPPEGARKERRPRAEVEAPTTPRRDFGTGRWFVVNVGRRTRAEPRWLLPLVCRLGQVTRTEVGAIRIFDRETRVEIVEAAAERFAAAVAQAAEGEIRIRPDGDGPPAEDVRRPRRREDGDAPPRPRPRREDEGRRDDRAEAPRPRAPRPATQWSPVADGATAPDERAETREKRPDKPWKPRPDADAPGQQQPGRKPHRKGQNRARPEGAERMDGPPSDAPGSDGVKAWTKPFRADKPAFKDKPGFKGKPAFKDKAGFKEKPAFKGKAGLGKGGLGKGGLGKGSLGKAARPGAGDAPARKSRKP